MEMMAIIITLFIAIKYLLQIATVVILISSLCSFIKTIKIILIYLPLYLIHLLQPLDLVIFLQLIHLYSSKVNKYAICGITRINKEYFLRILGEIYVRKKFTSIFTAFGSIQRPNAHFAQCNMQRMVSTQVRHTAAFNNIVQLIAHLQPPRQVIPFILNVQLIYHALFAHLQPLRQVVPFILNM